MEVCFSELYLEIAPIFLTVYKNVLIALWILKTGTIQIYILGLSIVKHASVFLHIFLDHLCIGEGELQMILYPSLYYLLLLFFFSLGLDCEL